MVYLYVYRIASDTGFAPCAEKGLLSLACCKGGQIRNGKIIHTGLRYRIGAKKDGADYTEDDVYVLGTYQDKMLYLAKVTDVVTMEEYFSGRSKGRTDDIYKMSGGKLVRNNRLREEDVHTDEDRIKKDLAGEYVLLSEDFIYLGVDAVSIDIVEKYNAVTRETKVYKGETAEQIVAECRKYQDNKVHSPNKPYTKCGGCR